MIPNTCTLYEYTRHARTGVAQSTQTCPRAHYVLLRVEELPDVDPQTQDSTAFLSGTRRRVPPLIQL